MVKSLLASLLAIFLTLLNHAPAQAQRAPQPWKIVSWASPLGPQALSYDYLCGLKAMISFLNMNGGADGRPIEIYSQEMDDFQTDFPNRLNDVLQQVQPDLVVGGAANSRAKATADYFRRLGLIWFGPWTNNSGAYQGRVDDPIGLLPTVDEELELLIDHAAKRLPQNSEILFIYYQSAEGQLDAELAAQKAKARSLVLAPVPLLPNFRNWGELEDEAMGAGAVMLWLPTGPAAAIVRTLKNRLPEDTLWMTNSLNSPGMEVTEMTGGLWEGMIFPAVLSPKSSLAQAYDAILYKYGPRGLTLDYQTYLGVAQGQILVKALLNAPANSNSATLRQAFKEATSNGTLLYPSSFDIGKPPKGASYLAVATANWDWQPVPD
ncbi:MAG: ABC transporter substrate-binding protein [Deltaproteobacteria bacterium]|nr:ABC transporter substrate-binding protein [Deltaproteobacteria bacterium]